MSMKIMQLQHKSLQVTTVQFVFVADLNDFSLKLKILII